MRSHASCQRAQNTIEYLLLVTAVGVVLIVAVLVRGGVFIRGTDAVLDFPGDRIDTHRAEMNFVRTP